MQHEFEIEWITLVGILNAAKVGYYEEIIDHIGKIDLKEYETLLQLMTFLCHNHGELKIIMK